MEKKVKKEYKILSRIIRKRNRYFKKRFNEFLYEFRLGLESK